jgi:hypothetical protein
MVTIQIVDLADADGVRDLDVASLSTKFPLNKQED